MSTLNPCSPVVLPTQRPLPTRWLDDLMHAASAAWQRWQHVRELHAELRAMDGLSDATLRDIGLAERRFDEPTLSRLDWERGRWQ